MPPEQQFYLEQKKAEKVDKQIRVMSQSNLAKKYEITLG